MTHRLQESADAVVLAPATPAAASVIWLHGLGADGHDFVPIVPELKLPAAPAVRFIFPHAPVRPVTLNNGMRMRAWYDLQTLTAEGRADEAGIRESAARLGEYVARRARGRHRLDAHHRRRIFAGRRGGAARGTAPRRAARRNPRALDLPAARVHLPAERADAELRDADPDVPRPLRSGAAARLGVMARDALRALGYAVEWKEYPMQHQVCLPEIQEVSRWLQSRFGAP